MSTKCKLKVSWKEHRVRPLPLSPSQFFSCPFSYVPHSKKGSFFLDQNTKLREPWYLLDNYCIDIKIKIILKDLKHIFIIKCFLLKATTVCGHHFRWTILNSFVAENSFTPRLWKKMFPYAARSWYFHFFSGWLKSLQEWPWNLIMQWKG